MSQQDAADTSPDLGGKMSSRPSTWLFDVGLIGGRHELESFLSLDLFSLRVYVQKHFSGPLTGGGQSPPPPWTRRCWHVPHFDPTSTGQAACRVLASLSPLLSRLYQTAHDPCTATIAIAIVLMSCIGCAAVPWLMCNFAVLISAYWKAVLYE